MLNKTLYLVCNSAFRDRFHKDGISFIAPVVIKHNVNIQINYNFLP